MSKQSSTKASKLAGKYLRAKDADLLKIPVEKLFADLRSLAASVLAQDETKGGA